MEYLAYLAGFALVVFVAHEWGRKTEQKRCATIARMFQEERGAFIATAIESELLP